jgi:histone deacetylase 1/2
MLVLIQHVHHCAYPRCTAAIVQVSYFYDAELGDFYYGPTHPMKPHRVRMAHDLIVRYDLYKHLQVRLAGTHWGTCSRRVMW